VILYRYLSAENALKSLQRNQFRVSQLATLNDIFDCSPIFFPDDPEDQTTKEAERVLSSIHNALMGVLCFSRENDNLLLWAHYSSGYSGIALGFDREVLKNSAKTVSLKAVDYSSDERPRFIESDSTGENRYNSVMDLYSRKGSKWSYEAEERLFMGLHACQVEGTEYFTGFPANSLKQILLGPRCQLDKNLILRSALRGGFSKDIDILKTVASRTRFELEFTNNWL